jgi:hypothetical protein
VLVANRFQEARLTELSVETLFANEHRRRMRFGLQLAPHLLHFIATVGRKPSHG